MEVQRSLLSFNNFLTSSKVTAYFAHGKLFESENWSIELPYALYDSQDMLLTEIIKRGKLEGKRGLAVLGGVQINTGPDTLDYFHPLRFDLINCDGSRTEDLLEKVKK